MPSIKTFSLQHVKKPTHSPLNTDPSRVQPSCRERYKLTEILDQRLRKIGVTISKPVLAILCITFGILAIAWEPLLRYIVGILLIIAGILLLTEHISPQQPPPPPP